MADNGGGGGGGGGCGCLSLVLLMAIVGLGAWSLFDYAPKDAVGIGIIGGFGAFLMSPCVLIGAVVVAVGVVIGIMVLFDR